MSQSAGEVVSIIVLNALPFFMAAGIFYMMFRVIRAATARNHGGARGVTAEGGTIIPVKASFAGVRGFPSLFAVATNNANPLFAVGAAGIEYRVIRKHKRPFTDIERIGIRTAWRTVNIEMQFKGDALTLALNVGTKDAARRALALFPSATPMTPQARAILMGPAA